VNGNYKPSKKKMTSMKTKLLLATLLAFTLADFAGAKEQVPFKGSLAIVQTGEVQGATLIVNGTGTGHGTHLGRFTLTYQEQVDLQTGIGVGTVVFTAANGDSVFAVFTGQAAPTSDPNVLSLTEVYTITGGTGRFADATGGFTLERLLNLTTGISSGSFRGTISRVGNH